MCQNKGQEGRKSSILPLWFWETDTKTCSLLKHLQCWTPLQLLGAKMMPHCLRLPQNREKRRKKNAPLTNTVESLGAVLNSISVFLFHLPRLTGFSLTLLVGLLPNLKGDISGEREGHWKNKKSVSYGQIVNVCFFSLTHTHFWLCICKGCIALAGSRWPLKFWSAHCVFGEELGTCQLGNYFNNSSVRFILYSVEPRQR